MAAQVDEKSKQFGVALYTPSFINVEGDKWAMFGYGLITLSTCNMILQGLKIPPAWLWPFIDDCTTVCFTFELLTRIVEKGPLFFTEEEKNWNFFDSMVVGISLTTMLINHLGSHEKAHGPRIDPQMAKGMDKDQLKKLTAKKHTGGGANLAQVKALRTLRLLRLLRLLRFLRSVGQVTFAVDYFLRLIVVVFVSVTVVISLAALLVTLFAGMGAFGVAWLRVNDLPKMPTIK